VHRVQSLQTLLDLPTVVSRKPRDTRDARGCKALDDGTNVPFVPSPVDPQANGLQIVDAATGALLRTISPVSSCPAIVNGLAYVIAYPSNPSLVSLDLDAWGP
jgi:hypothetical protein